MRIEVAGKQHVVDSIVAGVSRRAAGIIKDSLQIAKRQDELKSGENLAAIEEVLDQLSDLQDRKVSLVVDAFKNKFSVDDLESSLTMQEIDKVINEIMGLVGRTVQKN